MRVLLIGMLLLACSSPGSLSKGEERLARMRSRVALDAPYTLEGRSGEAPFRFAVDPSGHWRWDEPLGEQAFGLDDQGVWSWQSGEPVRRLGFGSATELASRAFAWSAGRGTFPGEVRARDGALLLASNPRAEGSRLELGPEDHPQSLYLPSGRVIAFHEWSEGAEGTFPLRGDERTDDGRRRTFETESLTPGRAATKAPEGQRHAASFTTGEATAIPIVRTPGGRILVQGMAGDGTDLGWFLLDTGAGPTCIAPRLARELGLEVKRQREVIALGGAVSGDIVDGPELVIGPMTLPGHDWVAVELGSLEDDAGRELSGILGLEFFLAAHVEIEPEGEVLWLGPSAPPQPGSFPVRFDGRQPCIEAEIEGSALWLSLDTGATDSLILNSPFVREKELTGPDRATRSATLEGLGGRQRVERSALRSGSLGGVSLQGVEASLALTRRGVLARVEPSGLVGMALLGHRRLVLDLGAGWWSWPMR